MRPCLGIRFDFSRQIAITKPQLSTISSYAPTPLKHRATMTLPLITVAASVIADAGYFF